MSTVSMMFGCLRVLPTQNSAVTFFWYSFSDSPCRFGRNSFTAKVVPPFFVDALIKRTVPPAPEPNTRPHFPYFFDICTCVACDKETVEYGAVPGVETWRLRPFRSRWSCCLSVLIDNAALAATD